MQKNILKSIVAAAALATTLASTHSADAAVVDLTSIIASGSSADIVGSKSVGFTVTAAGVFGTVDITGVSLFTNFKSVSTPRCNGVPVPFWQVTAYSNNTWGADQWFISCPGFSGIKGEVTIQP